MQRSPKLLMVCQTAALTMRALEEQAAHETQANSGAFRTRIEFELEFVKAGGMLLAGTAATGIGECWPAKESIVKTLNGKARAR